MAAVTGPLHLAARPRFPARASARDVAAARRTLGKRTGQPRRRLQEGSRPHIQGHAELHGTLGPPPARSSQGQEEGTGLWLAPQDSAWHAVGISETTRECPGQTRGHTGNRRQLHAGGRATGNGREAGAEGAAATGRSCKGSRSADDLKRAQRAGLPRAGLRLEATRGAPTRTRPAARNRPLLPRS